MRRTTLTLTAGLLAATAACSSSTTDRPAAPTPTLTAAAQTGGAASPAQPSAAAPAADASAALAKLTAAVKTVKAGVTVTAESDPNHLLGRPGQYTSKITFSDSRIKAADVEGEKEDSVNRGGAIEVFASEADAKARSEYIQGIVKGMPALMEYDYVRGPVLVRVSRLLTPDQAKALQAAV
ncbi:hypothetical protein [Kitasatospora cathayae]|uniref:Lipoprotein n=1 Tax=Kitasatospora cathayae TaxID=3004092 RepID=A0ABY7QA15_9ACTN|nr:hypothetical protein [Kitasatospora sp. HUAS 3-15]WBP89549.1 hypothetical protein O1G21_29370 [Kitasatospora sp. HUAS 3-15]